MISHGQMSRQGGYSFRGKSGILYLERGTRVCGAWIWERRKNKPMPRCSRIHSFTLQSVVVYQFMELLMVKVQRVRSKSLKMRALAAWAISASRTICTRCNWRTTKWSKIQQWAFAKRIKRWNSKLLGELGEQ